MRHLNRLDGSPLNRHQALQKGVFAVQDSQVECVGGVRDQSSFLVDLPRAAQQCESLFCFLPALRAVSITDRWHFCGIGLPVAGGTFPSPVVGFSRVERAIAECKDVDAVAKLWWQLKEG